MNRLTTLFAVITTAFLASACSLTVPNIEWCRDKGALGAHCAWTNEGTPRDIPKADWDHERFGQFCTKEDGFAKNQLFFEQACELVKNCDIEKVKTKIAEIMAELNK